ncbi:hypothetical protein BOO69_15780 [Sulfitobacter alexandrii]|uniref:Long-chain acyl-CoA synthetase n=1 Tax=Sulfitobacter alexandrii TaxID=1917485 RepID=A0A1J0WK23_9RHOB|nr:fatty acid--CoA ligase family protein [Sulfitobacter alexandrii]APE44703.1 hypothetical protein BOO69_15780 [Sulfitobacter alexandrii]
MTDNDRFAWKESARLFAGPEEIARPDGSGTAGFEVIAPMPTAACLARLGARVRAAGGFCVGDGVSLPEGSVPPGHFVTLTGGSTGRPKAILRRHRSWTASFAQNAALLGIGSADRVAIPGSLDHSLALYGVLEALHLGADVHVLDRLTPRAQVARCREQGVSVLYATPTQLLRLVRASDGGTLPALRLILCGGGALQPEVRDAIGKLAPAAALYVFYGSAETSFVTLGGPGTPDGAVGGAYPGVTLRILDPEGRPTDGTGEVWARSPYLFERYLGGPDATVRARDGFVSVGEIGWLDTDGQIWLSGRLSRMVQIADRNVHPEAVEAVIRDLTDVSDCAVLPRPDPLRGHRLEAWLEGPEDSTLADRVQRACREALGPLVAPRAVHFAGVLPRLPSGKIDLAALSRLAERAR